MRKWLTVLFALALMLCLPALAEEQVLADNELLFIRVDGFEMNPAGEAVMLLTLENRAEYTVMFSVRDCVVDGYALDPFWAADVAPGETYETALSWHGLTEIPTHISLVFYAYNEENWSEDNILDQPFTLFPLGEENVRLQPYERSETDVVLVETPEITVIVTGYEPGGSGKEPGVQLHLENRAPYAVMLSMDNVVTDGVVNDPYWSEELPANSMVNAVVCWGDLTALPAVISFDMKAYNSSDWFAPELYEGSHVLCPGGEAQVTLPEYIPTPTDVVLAETPEVLVVVTGFEQTFFGDVEMKLYIRNNTDQSLTIAMEDCVVDGMAASSYWGAELPACSVAHEAVTWLNMDTIPTAVRFRLSVSESDDWTTGNLIDRQILFFPQGEENARYAVYTPAETDVPLYESEELSIWMTGWTNDEIWGVSMHLTVVNRSEQTLVIDLTDCIVDGTACDPLWVMTSPADSVALEQVTWMELLEIPGEVSFRLEATEGNVWGDCVMQGEYTVIPAE